MLSLGLKGNLDFFDDQKAHAGFERLDWASSPQDISRSVFFLRCVCVCVLSPKP